MSEKQVIIADSTQIDAFMTCERLWNYAHRLRLAPASNAGARSSDAMNMGTLGHSFMERYYKDIDRSIELALEYDPDNETCECGHKFNQHLHPTHEIEDHGCLICNAIDTKEYCAGWRPKLFPLDALKRNEVRQRFREYCYTYSRGNDIVPASPESVEVGFSHKLYEDDDYLFVLEGRFDIADATISGMPCIVDHKFQLRKHDIYKKSIQFRNYAMVKRVTMLVVNYVRLSKTVDKDTFKRDIASFTAEEHTAWEQELISIYKRMALAVYGGSSSKYVSYDIKSGEFEPRWSSCSGRFGYACDFTPLCEELNPQLKAMKQQTMYQIKPEWKPW